MKKILAGSGKMLVTLPMPVTYMDNMLSITCKLAYEHYLFIYTSFNVCNDRQFFRVN